MKNPAILFYTSDFLTGTTLMSNEEVGAYIRVLCLQHQKGHLAESEVKQICKKKSTFSSVILHFKKDKKGLFFNKRMDIEKEKRLKYSESRAKNRSKDSKTYEKDMRIICNSYEKHMENENENTYYINNNNINNNLNIEKILNIYTNTINSNISSIEYEKLNNYIEIFKNDLRIIVYAIEYCKLYKAYNINYLCKILNNWEKSGYKTLEQIKEQEKIIKQKEQNLPEEDQEILNYNWLEVDNCD